MSKLGQLKKQWDYENSVPRCVLCRHYVASFYRMTTNSQAKTYSHHCHLGGFTVNPNGVCDKWQTKDGIILESTKCTPS